MGPIKSKFKKPENYQFKFEEDLDNYVYEI